MAANRELSLAKQEIKRLAYVDAVTLIPNKRAFDLAVTREIEDSPRQQSPLAVVIADVDRFKQFNELYGYLEGDACLASLGTAIAQNISRPGDFCARYGGEESAIVLPDTDLEDALQLIEGIRESIQDLALSHSGKSAGVVTMSFGISAVETVPVGIDIDVIRKLIIQIQDADEALYQAKSSGRNKIVARGFGIDRKLRNNSIDDEPVASARVRAGLRRPRSLRCRSRGPTPP
ncbi:diguanylate cyclase (GGDEF)-like protein [Agrobacterium larrymoorei]|uniref:diguanylate cyclase n=1 Tax=Agrobacterium larrymoorei TaxID=160699 RepID=A0AAJ2ER92_9HYPH|nr:diguanylate cyclase [Agrobacterium larrymoorei]MDR6100178.1 diguanylate cyclase (GGDEF)-like protein [Agrobacterium larrymoorei]